MRPSRRVLPKALIMTMVAGLFAAGPVLAQYYDPAVRALGQQSDVARSPRLIGMGGLSLSVADHHQRFTLWDFAGVPVGLGTSDSASTLDLRMTTGSAEGVHAIPTGDREDLAGRATASQIDVFHRDAAGNVYGAVGTLQGLRIDSPYDAASELRRNVSLPDVMPVITGPFPYWGKGKLRYAINMQFASERAQDEYLTYVENANGQFLSLNGMKLNPPDLFSPTDYKVSRTSIGGSLSYPFGKTAQFAVSFDGVRNRMTGSSDQDRSRSQVSEARPYGVGEAVLVGKLGTGFEYGLDGRGWLSFSQQNWLFSVSAGSGAVPLSGRGKLLERQEQGASFNGRFRWAVARSAGLSGQLWSSSSRVTLTPPDAGDATSLNRFLDKVFYRIGADTLWLPDSIVADEGRRHATGFGLGGSWQFHKGVAGLEYHWSRDALWQQESGAGPRQVAWDVRGGLEYPCTNAIAGRLGAGWQHVDANEYIAHNAMKGPSASLGLGIHPPGTSWTLDLAYTQSWMYADFVDPTNARRSHEQVASILSWAF